MALLSGHDVQAAKDLGWEELKNGPLLAIAAENAFDAMITIDQNLRYQQNLTRLPLAVIVLRAPSNRLSDLAPLIPLIQTALTTLRPRTLIELGVAP